MGKDSAIEWTHHTFNPWWGCARVSPGCEHCYAEAFAKRTGKAKWGVAEPRRFFGDAHWREPLKWNAAAQKAGERHRVFCASMADVFEDRPELQDQRLRLWNLIIDTPHLDWLLLTKRPENLSLMLPWSDAEKTEIAPLMIHVDRLPAPSGQPWPNVWVGTTVEDMRRAWERIPELLKVKAAVRFLSCEPLLEAVDLRRWLIDPCDCRIPEQEGAGQHAHDCRTFKQPWGIDWVIVGGESGPGARPFALEWARRLVHECKAAGVAVHVKQLGADPIVGGLLRRVAGITDRKGGNWDEWPSDLRVREYPGRSA